MRAHARHHHHHHHRHRHATASSAAAGGTAAGAVQSTVPAGIAAAGTSSGAVKRLSDAEFAPSQWLAMQQIKNVEQRLTTGEDGLLSVLRHSCVLSRHCASRACSRHGLAVQEHTLGQGALPAPLAALHDTPDVLLQDAERAPQRASGVAALRRSGCIE